MSSIFPDTHEHPQVGPVRFVQDTENKGQAVWYDFYGNADVTNVWLAEHMGQIYPSGGGKWVVVKRHAGNGHSCADLQRE